MQRFTPDAKEGLTFAQVHLRQEEGLINAQPPHITKTTGRIIRDNLMTFFNLINAILFVALLLVNSYANTLFMGVVLSNLLIGVIQELRAKRAVERLSVLHAPRTRVVREGTEQEIPSEELVLDDILMLSLGNQVPADAVVREGLIEADESMLTGESNSIKKGPGDTLLSGSFVISGACRAQAERVGGESYAAKLSQEAKRYRRFDSELMRALRLIIRYAGGVVLPLGALMFYTIYRGLSHGLQSSVEQTAASMLGMIPSGLMLLTSVSLAVGVITLARKQTLVQELYCIETLSRVNMLCLDKTGTLTTGNMQVEQTIPLGNVPEAELAAMLSDIVGTMPAGNATANALAAFYTAPPREQPRGVTPFSSARKYSAAAFSYGTLYLGAANMLTELPERMRVQAEQAASSGRRVLLLCQSETTNSEPKPPQDTTLAPLALVTLLDEIRPEAADTLRFFREQDVTVKLISGDDARTVSAIAARLDLPGAQTYVDATTLKDDEALKKAAQVYTVFGRVSPQQKKGLIQALQAQGHTVAMTGDGVNDVLALKEADCSVALNAGSDAARQISQLVLLDNNFASLPHVVMEGRRVVNNITRTASLFLVKTGFSFLLTISSLLFGLAYPFQPVQLSLIGAVTVGIPSFFLALEPNRTRIKGSFLRNVLSRAIPGAVTIFLFTLSAGLIGRRVGLSYQDINSLCVYLAGTAGLMILLRVCLPIVARRAVLWVLMVAAFFGAAALFPNILELISPQPGIGVWLYLGLTLFSYPLLAGLERVCRHILKAED